MLIVDKIENTEKMRNVSINGVWRARVRVDLDALPPEVVVYRGWLTREQIEQVLVSEALSRLGVPQNPSFE